MNGTFTTEQLIQAGKDLVEFLMQSCNLSNNISGFLRDYIALLTAEDGIYSRQQKALSDFDKSGERIKSEAATMMSTASANTEQIKVICAQFEQLNNSIEEAQLARRKTDTTIQNLKAEINEIRSFVKNIEDVSEQVRLLSFNASIEAVRAGNAGKGFRVIANEVKTLSDKTQKLSSDIAQKIHEAEKEVQSIVTENAAHDNFMNSLQETTTRSGESLVKINQDTENNTRFTQKILDQITSEQENIVTAAKQTEAENIRQIQQIADRAAQNTIHTGDVLSFLFELKELFAYLSAHPVMFAE